MHASASIDQRPCLPHTNRSLGALRGPAQPGAGQGASPSFSVAATRAPAAAGLRMVRGTIRIANKKPFMVAIMSTNLLTVEPAGSA